MKEEKEEIGEVIHKKKKKKKKKRGERRVCHDREDVEDDPRNDGVDDRRASREANVQYRAQDRYRSSTRSVSIYVSPPCQCLVDKMEVSVDDSTVAIHRARR